MDELIGYSSPKACRATGVTYRQLLYWTELNVTPPSVLHGQGSGSQHLYSFDDLVRLRVVKALVELGLEPSAIPSPVPTEGVWTLDMSGWHPLGARLVVGIVVDATALGLDVQLICDREGITPRTARKSVRPRAAEPAKRKQPRRPGRDHMVCALCGVQIRHHPIPTADGRGHGPIKSQNLT